LVGDQFVLEAQGRKYDLTEDSLQWSEAEGYERSSVWRLNIIFSQFLIATLLDAKTYDTAKYDADLRKTTARPFEEWTGSMGDEVLCRGLLDGSQRSDE
jgi:hypothetical protein